MTGRHDQTQTCPSFSRECVEQGLHQLAHDAGQPGYVRLGAFNSMARILDMFPNRAGGQPHRPHFPADSPWRQVPDWSRTRAAEPAAGVVFAPAAPEFLLTPEARKQFHLHPCGNDDPLAEANNPTPPTRSRRRRRRRGPPRRRRTSLIPPPPGGRLSRVRGLSFFSETHPRPAPTRAVLIPLPRSQELPGKLPRSKISLLPLLGGAVAKRLRG